MKRSLRRVLLAAELMAIVFLAAVGYKFMTLTNWELFWLVAKYG